MHVLIDQHTDGMAAFEDAEHAANRAAPVDDSVTSGGPHAFQQIVQIRIVERPRQHVHWLEPQGLREPDHFPEPEVAREENHAASLRIGVLRVIGPFHFGDAQHLGRAERGEFQQLEENPPEMREHRSCDRALLPRGSMREGGREIVQSRTPVDAIQRVERESYTGAAAPDDPPRQHADERHGRADSRVLESVSHATALARARASASWPCSHSRNSARGSTDVFSGTQASFSGSGRAHNSRTASFSVVTASSAPARKTHSAIRLRSALV